MKTQSLFKLSPLMLVLASVSSSATLVVSEKQGVFDNPKLAGTKADKSHLGPLHRVVPDRYIIEFKGRPLAAYGAVKGVKTAAHNTKGKIDFGASATKAVWNQLAAERNEAVNALHSRFPSAKVTHDYNVVFNGVAVEGNGLDIEALKKLPNVSRVFRDELIQIKMDVSLPIIQAPAAWTALGGQATAGKGIRVAVVDSGIRPENPMFDDAGMTAPDNLPNDDYCHKADPSFCNNKLIVARYYDAPSDTIKDEHTDSPLGYDGHGTHVAGTAVGVPITATYQGSDYKISGVAPGAYLMAYKALYENDTTASGLGSSLIAAVDDAVKDGADVINNSWGGGPGGDPNESAYKTVFENAEAAGVVVVSAAGNDGNDPQSIGCPGCVESGITVANTQTGRSFVNMIDVQDVGNLFAVEGSSSVQLSSLDAASLKSQLIAGSTVDAANVEGCNAFAKDSFKDSYALISRGSCTFTVKAANVEAAGAKGIVVYNNQVGAPFPMAMDTAKIPGVMVSNTDGAKLEKALAAGPLALTLDPALKSFVDDSLVDVMNSSSSRGPNGDNSFIKPDLAAPGTNILSAFSPDEAGDPSVQFAVLTGTSMASPHVAGAAALVLAAHPGWSPAQVKAALTTTSNTNVKDDDGVTPAGPFAMGAGRLDVANAINAGLAVAPVSVSGPNCVSRCSFEVAASSLAAGDATWKGSVTFDDSGIDATLSTNELSLAKGASGSFTLNVDARNAAKEEWHFGQVTWTDSSGKMPSAHMPVAIYSGNSTDARLLTSTGGTLVAGDSLKAQTRLTNTDIDGLATVKVKFPVGLHLAADPVAVVTDGSQSSMSFDAGTNTATWAGTLSKPYGRLGAGSTWIDSLPSLTDGYSPSVVSCGSDCDEGSVTLDVSTYNLHFMGKAISSLTLNTNGFITFDGATVAASYYNDDMPTSKANGAVLAPFWTDLDMTKTGQWYYSILNDGTADYLVFEWKDVSVYGDNSGNVYTFQTLFKLGSDEVYVHYVNMAPMPQYVTAGVQDAQGVKGSVLYLDGTGTAPASGTSYQVEYQNAGTLTLSYDLNSTAIKAENVAVSTQERSAVTLNLLPKLSGSSQLIDSTVSSDTRDAEALSLVQVEPKGEAVGDGVVITKDAANGVVIVNKTGLVTYTANEGFTGTDSFSYVLTDEGGTQSSEGTVTVTVNAKPAPAAASHGGGGAFGLFGLLLAAPLAWQRRRKR
ncbi:S8 family serine peptidase [Gallaecimonas kandeliae]|uniref:S8 family serine peptidase n=1 Tax=Gallaecimonas kandeliae TaxID=3029055 RepID=UPI00264A3DFA|nr:S8 family serine peptidase [Gallaecimonas kandeliae]WKE65903.1 S8 family serine peptidase [Gallaecimonas kandeliae]